MEEFESIDLIDELESRGFTVIDETESGQVEQFLRDLPEDDVLISELSSRGYDYISDDGKEIIDQLGLDYLPEMFDLIKDHGYFVVDTDVAGIIDFRKNDCKGLIEDIVKRRGWDYLHEVLISC